MFKIKNRFGKECRSCGEWVETGDGFAVKDDSGWFTVCSSSACHRDLGLVDENGAPPKPRREITTDGRVIMPFEREALPLLRSLPVARFDGESKCWTCSVSEENLPRVIEIARKLKLDIPESMIKSEKDGTVDTQEAEKRCDRIGTSGQALYPFQRGGVKFLALHKRALLGDDMGVGKTIQALVALPEPEKSRVLIICPASVKFNWQNEMKIWRPDYSSRVVKGKKGFVLPERGESIIANYDILPGWLSPTISTGRKTKKGDDICVADTTPEQEEVLAETIVICDEAHLVKNYKAMRSKKITQLSRLCDKIWFLTGTPLMNKPFDLFGVLCSGGMNPFGYFGKFIRLFNGEKGEYGGYTFGMPMPEVSEMMRNVMLRRLKKDVLPDLPDKTYQTIEIDKIDRETKRFLDSEMDRLKSQFSDLPDFTEFSRARASIAKSRIPNMIEIVEFHEEADDPLVVFSAHRAPIDELNNREGWATITGSTSPERRQEIVDEFQGGFLKGVGLTIQAGGVGLTLTRASSVLFVDLDWTPALNIQAEDRVCRIGQTANKVVIKRMVSNHPLDLRIQELLEHKIELAYRALDTRVEYRGKPDLKTQSSGLIEESDDDRAARIKQIEEAEKEADRELAREKVRGVLRRESKRAAGGPREVELTDEIKDLLHSALDFMTGVCDGAVLKDGAGFSKPDTGIAHWIAETGMDDDDDETYRVLERILCRYKRQLSAYPSYEENIYQKIWG